MIHYLNLQYFFYQIYRLLQALWQWPPVPGWVAVTWFVLYLVSFGLIAWIAVKIIKQRQAESRDLQAMLANSVTEKPEQNRRWERVQKYLESENPAEWKLAIIEADNMLDEVIKTLQPHGENLGERLKAIEPADFETLQDAWEAHKVRNQIAHETNFTLTRRQVTITINQFKKVFEEFEYI